MRGFLANLIATITGKPRYFPEYVGYMPGCWVHSAFRLFENIFGRQVGIRKETTVWNLGNGETGRICHTLESKLAHFEMDVRAAVKKLAAIRIYIPVLVTPTGQRVFASPYLFAIAQNGSSVFTDLAASPCTSPSFTVSAGNVVVVNSFGGTTGASGCTVNGVSTSAISGTSGTDGTGGNYLTNLFFQPSPSAGSQTAAVTTASGTIAIVVQLYSGAGSTVPTGTQYKTAGSPVTANGTSPATTAWGIVCGACSPTAAASTNVTFWSSSLGHSGQMFVGDSNGATGTTGSYSQVVTGSSAMQILQCFLTVPAAASNTFRGFFAMVAKA